MAHLSCHCRRRDASSANRVINAETPGRAPPVRKRGPGRGHDQTFRIVGEDETDLASDLGRLAVSQGTGEAWPSVADIKIVAIGNAKIKRKL